MILILLLCSMSQLRIIRCFRQRFQLTKSTRPFFLQKESSLSSDSGKDDDTIRYDQLVGSSKVFLSSIKARSANSRVLTFDESTALTGLIKHHLPNLKATDLLVLMSFISDLKLGSSANKHSQELLSLLKRIADESTKFSDDQMHKMFLAMVNAKIRWDSITENLVLSDRFNELLLRGDGKLYSEMLWCIGSMGGEWRSLSTGSKEAVIEGLESTLFNITPYTLSSVLWSLAKTGIKWSQLKNVGSSVLRAISRIAEITSPQQSSKVCLPIAFYPFSFIILSFLDIMVAWTDVDG